MKTYQVTPDGKKEYKKYKNAKEEEATDALLSMTLDKVDFLQEIRDYPKNKHKVKQHPKTFWTDDDEKILPSWSTTETNQTNQTNHKVQSFQKTAMNIFVERALSHRSDYDNGNEEESDEIVKRSP